MKHYQISIFQGGRCADYLLVKQYRFRKPNEIHYESIEFPDTWATIIIGIHDSVIVRVVKS